MTRRVGKQVKSVSKYISGEKVDVFHLGVTLFVALFGVAPFEQASFKDYLYRYIEAGTFQNGSEFFRNHPSSNPKNRGG